MLWGALIAAVIVWLLLMFAAMGRPHEPEPAWRWLWLVLPAAALLLLVEHQQFSSNILHGLPPNLLLARDLSRGAAGLALAGALASIAWLWHSTRTGATGLRVGWVVGVIVLLVMLAITGMSWWWMMALRRIAMG